MGGCHTYVPETMEKYCDTVLGLLSQDCIMRGAPGDTSLRLMSPLLACLIAYQSQEDFIREVLAFLLYYYQQHPGRGVGPRSRRVSKIQGNQGSHQDSKITIGKKIMISERIWYQRKSEYSRSTVI